MAALCRRPGSASLLRGALVGASLLATHLFAAPDPAAASVLSAAHVVAAGDEEPALSRRELHRLVRRSDLVARVRVSAFTPASFNRQTHTGTAQQTEFAVEEVLSGARRVATFALTYLGPTEGGAGPAVGTEMIVFARYNAKDKLWEPADEVYAYAPSARLRRMILSEKR